MQKAEVCGVTTSYGDDPKNLPCDAPATIKCGGSWWCPEHYEDFHPDGQCWHVLPDEE